MTTGLIDLPWWGYIVVTLILTHITIAGVTIYLHRHQAHRALELHPLVSHFFRLWLWLTTGMVTKEWVAVHRKHHAKVETPEDPHSPIQAGINRVLWLGAFLYRKETAHKETLEQYGHNTPDDWMEKNIYTPYNFYGVFVMMAINFLLFGVAIGILIWAIQMAWIPFWAAGVINGIGHNWGYRHYETPDTSTNIVPFGALIGGEELHNNHHAFPSSAKFSNKWWEFDLGWFYIRLLETLGLAKVKKVAPEPAYNPSKSFCDIETVKAVITNRFQVLATFTRNVANRVYTEELGRIKPLGKAKALFKRGKSLMAREPSLLDEAGKRNLQEMLAQSNKLETVYTMKEKLQKIWKRSTLTHENLKNALEEWCKQAEATRIKVLQDFSRKLRTYTTFNKSAKSA